MSLGFRFTKEQFIEKAKQVHGNTYDYSLVEYINNKTNIKIICPRHGIFEQLPNNHFSKYGGCSECAVLAKQKYYKNIFLKNIKQIHGNLYSYENIVYVNNFTPIKIICSKHGEFQQTPQNHMKGQHCPKCSNGYSKGEEKIEKWLSDCNINYIPQYRFIKCKNIRTLPFDFFLPDHNICIEFDGIYHYEPFKGLKNLTDTIKNDKIKNKFCIDNNIKLIRIPYWELNKIDEIMSNMIFRFVKFIIFY